MGGNAFHSILNSSAFPRIPPAAYHALKVRIHSLLEELYVYVRVPYEAPEKQDYGDLDFVVYLPRRHTSASQILTNNSTSSDVPPLNGGADEGGAGNIVNVPHDVVAATIGAKHINPMEGNRTSNFAIPIGQGEWAQYGHEGGEDQARGEAGGGEIFYQVDLNVCESKDEWERRVAFNSYGDLGMILGLIVRNAGLHLSQKGLKYPDVPNPPIILSESFDDIFSFFGWSMETWKNGFETTMACYEWAISSKYFNPAHFKSRGPGFKQRKPDRTVYAGFLEWAGSLSQQNPTSSNSEVPDARGVALDFFNKRAELDQRRAEQRHRELLKASFSGSRVRDWTGLGNYWPGVKKIMDGVREKFDGEANIAKFLDEEGVEKLRSIVLEVQEDLGIFPLPASEVLEVEVEDAEVVDKIKGAGELA